jgi:urease beta subunit
MARSSSRFTIRSGERVKPGEYFIREGTLELNEGRDCVRLRVDNAGDRPIQVGSHTHFFEVNRFLRFDRAEAYGRRLDIPAGTALRFEPGEGREVDLVSFGGKRCAYGMSALTDGPLDDGREAALARARSRGFVEDSR